MAQTKEQARLPVTKEVVVGTISDDPNGDPIAVALFNIIGTYEADHPEGGVYRFGDITVTVKHEDSGPGGDHLREWLARHHGYILTDYERGEY